MIRVDIIYSQVFIEEGDKGMSIRSRKCYDGCERLE